MGDITHGGVPNGVADRESWPEKPEAGHSRGRPEAGHPIPDTRKEGTEHPGPTREPRHRANVNTHPRAASPKRTDRTDSATRRGLRGAGSRDAGHDYPITPTVEPRHGMG
ncbi:hypothetical protein GCM10027444_03300 [Actinopolyspora lacussalsi]